MREISMRLSSAPPPPNVSYAVGDDGMGADTDVHVCIRCGDMVEAEPDGCRDPNCPELYGEW